MLWIIELRGEEIRQKKKSKEEIINNTNNFKTIIKMKTSLRGYYVMDINHMMNHMMSHMMSYIEQYLIKSSTIN